MQADLLTAGFGRTRMFIRYARSIAPWFHPPRWLFSIGANYFVDQVCPGPQVWGPVSERKLPALAALSLSMSLVRCLQP